MSFVSVLESLYEYFYHTFYRDMLGAVTLLMVRWKLFWASWYNKSVGEALEEQAARTPYKTMYIFGEKKWTFQEFNDYTNRVANYFYHQGFRKGDEVALLMESRAEYIGLWIGLSKIGVVTALVNPNLRSYSLAHSFNVVSIRAIIFQDTLEQALTGVAPLLKTPSKISFYALGSELRGEVAAVDLSSSLASMDSNLDPQIRHEEAITFRDPLFYAYTSGTTGLPKAAIVKHSRVFYMEYGMAVAGRVQFSDVIYCPLPAYHMIGIMGATFPLVTGCTTVIRHKFSASKYWKEFNQNKCTVAIYIGELCRFLLAQPRSEHDAERPVRLAISSGLRPTIWEDFVKRFAIRRVVEFYGSTEGNSSLINITGRLGAIGFLPKIFPNFIVKRLFPVTIIKVNTETGEPVRGRDGLCMEVTAGDTGMVVARINKGDSLMDFEGYVDREATSKKTITDARMFGDCYFSSGDLVIVDKYRYIYFKDRIGDTYRWRGENVSTNEVESIIARHLNLADVAVFGVEIPGVEGRAGMAAIVQQTGQQIDLVVLLSFLRKTLPSYALPYFIRLISEIKFTDTMKISKYELKQEAFNVDRIKDSIYFLDFKKGAYKPLSRDVYEDIMNAHHRF